MTTYNTKPRLKDGRYRCIYPWPELSIGESKLIPGGTNWNSIRVAAFAWGKRHGLRLSVHRTKDGIFVKRIK